WFEVVEEGVGPIGGATATVSGLSCTPNRAGQCSLELSADETHTAEASKGGYECDGVSCRKTFTGCPPEHIVLALLPV
ncbi:MAG: hypothetical protein KAU03_02680, partial [Candidatus Altiarchaeales archaeon]|nr:hypothetical protein [Candidatus Altiarchaeales archaeon]